MNFLGRHAIREALLIHKRSMISRNLQINVRSNTLIPVCRRCQSTFIQSVDSFLQFSTANPLYVGTAGFFDIMHSTTGLSWWASIIATTFCIRTVVQFPIMVAAANNQANLSKLSPELNEEMKKVAAATKHAKWALKLNDDQTQRAFTATARKARAGFYQEHNVHPLKSFVTSITSLPIWFTVSLTLRTMTGQFSLPPYPGFETEGGVWFTNLCLSDPTYVLPVLLGVSMLGTIKLTDTLNPAVANLTRNIPGLGRVIRLFQYGLVVLLPCIAAYQPSAIALYWLSSNASAMLQIGILSVPSVRRIVGIPKTEAEQDINNLMSRKS